MIESINGESLTPKYKICGKNTIVRGTVVASWFTHVPLFSNKTSFYSAFRVRSIKFLCSRENIYYQRIRNLILASNYDIEISVAAGVNEKCITRRKIKRLSIRCSRNHRNARKYIVANLSFLWTVTNSHFTYFVVLLVLRRNNEFVYSKTFPAFLSQLSSFRILAINDSN